jgi:hypothetical protein
MATMLTALVRAPDPIDVSATCAITSAQIASGRGLVNASQLRVLNSTYSPNTQPPTNMQPMTTGPASRSTRPASDVFGAV